MSKIAPLIVLSRNDQTIHEQLKIQDEINQLHMVIQKTEKAAWKEQQPKKRFELYTKLQEYKNNWRRLPMEKLKMHTPDLAEETIRSWRPCFRML